MRIPLTRLPDHEYQLLRFVRESATEPFVWGTRDCVTWAADAVIRMTGVDLIADLRGRYTDAAGAATVLGEAGYSSLREALEDRVGPPLRYTSNVWRGDLVWLPPELTQGACPFGAAAVYFNRVIAFVGERLSMLPLRSVIDRGAIGFRVGD